MKLRASSGSYNVRASELASQVSRPGFARTVTCTVYFLDDTEASFEIDVSRAVSVTPVSGYMVVLLQVGRNLSDNLVGDIWRSHQFLQFLLKF